MLKALSAAAALAIAGCASAPPTPPNDPMQAPPHAAPASPPAPATVEPVAEPPATPPQRDAAAEIVLTALNFIDVPYRRGGNSAERGFDCSGFTRHVYERSAGIALPRRADDQAGAPGFVGVRRTALQPGDLVFFNTLRRTFSHVGIYVGDGRFVHAPKPGAQVRVEDMRVAYWSRRFTGARRPGVALAEAARTFEP